MIGDSMPGDKRISANHANNQAGARSIATPGGARFTAAGGIVSPMDTPGLNRVG